MRPRQGPSKWPRCPFHGLPMPPKHILNRFVIEHRCGVRGCPGILLVELAGTL